MSKSASLPAGFPVSNEPGSGTTSRPVCVCASNDLDLVLTRNLGLGSTGHLGNNYTCWGGRKGLKVCPGFREGKVKSKYWGGSLTPCPSNTLGRPGCARSKLMALAVAGLGVIRLEPRPSYSPPCQVLSTSAPLSGRLRDRQENLPCPEHPSGWRRNPGVGTQSPLLSTRGARASAPCGPSEPRPEPAGV